MLTHALAAVRLSGTAGGVSSLSGRALIAGTASLLMCLFLSPRFITFLRHR
jgi:hypothetical protein